MFQQTTLDATQDHDFVPLTESVQIDLNAPPGSQIGRYEVIRAVGRGGMGVVYLARDPQLDRAVALKLVRPSLQEDERADHFERRLMREARAMAKLSHPNVLTIYDVGLHGQQVFLASEWIDGCTLDQWMGEGPHNWRSVVKRFTFAARGLAAAHRAGLVHRDFKPSNVMLGKDDRVHVFDFGLVKAIQPSLGDITTQLSGQFVVGTPAYMSPEQMTGEAADERSDQFSFCVALYEALAERRPFSGRNITDILSNIGAGQVVEPKKIPKWLWDMIRRGLSRDPNDRHDSMRAIVDILEKGIRHSKRRTAIAIGAFSAAAAMAAGVGYWSGHSGSVQPSAAKLAAEVAADVAGGGLAADMEPEFERLSTLQQGHKYNEVITSVQLLLPKVGAHRVSEARLWAAEARALGALGRYDEAAQGFEKGFYAAVAGRDDELAAHAAAEIYGIHAVRLHNAADAERWKSLAGSAVERSGSAHVLATWHRIEGDANLVIGDVVGSCESYSESLRVLELSEAADEALRASALQGLGGCNARQGQLAEAKKRAQQAVAAWGALVGNESPEHAMATVVLAEILMQEGDAESARSRAETASTVLIATYGETHPSVARVLNSLAKYSVALGDADAANRALLRALKIKRELFGVASPQLASTLMNLMDVDRMRARYRDAVIHGTEAVALLEQSGAPDAARRLQRAKLSLAEAQLATDQSAEALATCRALYARFETLGGVTALSRGRALSCMARALLSQGKRAQGIMELDRALKSLEQAGGPSLAVALFAAAKNNANPELANQQAERARDALAKAGTGWSVELAAVEAWLASLSPQDP
jgi:tetratricopeptide (TPR) repeat protein